MQRVSIALLLPLAVFPMVLAIAFFIGWTLHQVRDLGIFPPLVALILTVAITAGGFIADSRADR